MKIRHVIEIMIVILICIIILISKAQKNNPNNQNLIFNGNESKDYEWLEEEQKYVVYDENGNVRGYANDEYGLKIFKDNPDYNMDSVPIGYYDQKEIIEYDK